MSIYFSFFFFRFLFRFRAVLSPLIFPSSLSLCLSFSLSLTLSYKKNDDSCLGRCTYCKTVHARGKLGSYPLEALVARVASAARDPRVREVWLSSEDTGAYGRDIGADLPTLLRALAAVLPRDGRTMLRVGMTNPPYVLSYLKELEELLGGGNEEEGGFPIFRFLHVPVQSGSDAVLERMRREYSVADFEAVARAVRAAEATLATDVIVGFPGETAADAQATVDLIQKWKPRATHVSKFYPRPGTPAAKWERPPARDVAARSRAVAAAVDTLEGAWDHLVGSVQRVWVVDVATDGEKLVGHTRDYAQVLLPRRQTRKKKKKNESESDENEKQGGDSSCASVSCCLGASLGDVLDVEITSASRWIVKGKVVKIVLDGDEAAEEALKLEEEEEEEGEGGARKGEAVAPAPRRAAASGPTTHPPRPETPDAPAFPRAARAEKEEKAAVAATAASSPAAAAAPCEVEAAISSSTSTSSSSSSSLFYPLALAVIFLSFAVAVALRERAEKWGEVVVVAAGAAEETPSL